MSFISTPTPLPVSQGGTGESNPSLIAGAGIVIAGPWPDQTISATGSSYVEVANYAALPAPATVPGAIYVVLASTGIYFINRRSAGFYQSDGIAWTYLAEIGENYFNDANLEFFDDADPSKIVRFSLGGLTTGTTRTYTTPNASGTLALTSDIPSPIVSSVTASSPLASSGGANPNITLTSPLPIANGGTATATPALVAGTGIAITGTWPNNTITNSAGSGIASVGASWNFDTSTVAGDPGNKKFRLNTATLATVTQIYLNDTTNDGVDISTIASFLAAGNRIYIQQKNDATRAALYQVTGAATDNVGWWTVPVVVVADGGVLFQNNADCGFVLLLNAAAGTGSGATFTAFTQDLGAARSSGTFDITGLSGLTVGKFVDIQQTAAAIATKGNAQDEGQFDSIDAWGIVLDAATIRAQWRATGVVVGTYAFAYLVSA